VQDSKLLGKTEKVHRRLQRGETVKRGGIKSDEAYLLHPCREIAKACRVADRTIRMWMLKHGLPVFHLPDGSLATTLGLIDEWAKARRARQLAQPISASSRGPRYGADRFAVRSREVA